MPNEKTLSPKVLEVVKHFDTLPDAGAVSCEVGEVVSTLSGRTLRKHTELWVRLSQKRMGLNVGRLRALLRGELA
jgi:hypothetical protein